MNIKLPAQAAEPIGVVATNPILNTIGSAYVVRVLVGMPDAVRVGDKLYTAPPPAQQPLTDEQINPHKAAAELRRLAAYCQELESQVILDCMTHDSKPLAAGQAPARPVSTWCDGCSPENCVGCHIPSEAAAKKNW